MKNNKNKLWLGVKIVFIVFLFITTLYSLSMEKQTSCVTPSDALLKFRSFDDIAPGAFEDVLYNEKTRGIELFRNEKGFVQRGRYTSPPLSTGFLIKEIIPSWNIVCPKGCGYLVEIRVSQDGKAWSPWLYFGRGGSFPRPKERITRNALGEVKIDYFISGKGVTYAQYGLHLLSEKGIDTPVMTLFSLAISDHRGDLNLALRTSPSKKIPPFSGKKMLCVPYRSQGAEDSSIAGEICSPTSISMVMHYWGIDRPTAEVARGAYDPDYKMYGMWWRGVQCASQYGLSGWVQTFRNWAEVEEWINANQPVIACISFDKGKLEGSMTPESEGHVLVIAGFDEKGNPVCNDPAGSCEDDGVVTYDKDELAAAWFDKGGVGYIIQPPGGEQ